MIRLSVFDYIVDFTFILNYLDKLGAKIEEIEDEDQALLLLCLLYASYKAFRDIMMYSREKIILEEGKSNLQVMLHLDNKMTNVEKESQSVGLVVDQSRSKDRNPKDSRTHSKSKHTNLTCNYYKKKGHIKANCFKLKNKQKVKDKDIASDEANVADCDTVDILCMLDTNIDDKNCWVINTSAS